MKKEISLKSFIIVLAVLVILEMLIFAVIIPLIKNNKKMKELAPHCDIATCSMDNTICYNYDEQDGHTIVTWRGDCSKYFNK